MRRNDAGKGCGETNTEELESGGETEVKMGLATSHDRQAFASAP